METFDGGWLARCVTCEKSFVDYAQKRGATAAKHCPACNDKRQSRPSVVEERECTGLYTVKVESLPGEFGYVHPGPDFRHDYGYWKLDISAKEMWGVQWRGRLVCYSTFPVVPGLTVQMRVMTVSHKVRCIVAPGLHDPEHEIISELPLYQPLPEALAGELPEGVRLEERVRSRGEYVVFEQPDGSNPVGDLIWRRVDYKTTLKGYGRQYGASIDAESTYWHRGFSATCRSGRFGSQAVLAITNERFPLRVSQWGDVEDAGVTWFPPSAAPPVEPGEPVGAGSRW